MVVEARPVNDGSAGGLDRTLRSPTERSAVDMPAANASGNLGNQCGG